MSKRCDISGKQTAFGNRVSHANNKTRRKFFVNLHKRRFFLSSSGRWLQLTVCSSVLRSIHKYGIEDVLKKYQRLDLLK